MHKVIQLRGCNGSGKTTTVNQFIARNGLKPSSVDCCGRKWEIQTGKGIVILAKRGGDGNIRGLDGYVNSREELVQVVPAVLDITKPEIMIFEGFIYGLSYKLGAEINQMAKSRGYKYIAVNLDIPPEVSLNRIYHRNGGKKINEERIWQKCAQAMRAYGKLKAAGIETRLFDTSKIPPNQMYRILEEVVNG